MDPTQKLEEDIELTEYAILKQEYRRLYMAEYSKLNYEKKLKNSKVKCSICEKDYNVTNRWKHNSSKFHNFFKDLIEARGLKAKQETI